MGKSCLNFFRDDPSDAIVAENGIAETDDQSFHKNKSYKSDMSNRSNKSSEDLSDLPDLFDLIHRLREYVHNLAGGIVDGDL